MAKQYTEDGISVLSRKEYLEFYKELFPLIREHTKTYGRIAFLIGDWPPARRAYATEEGTSKVFRRWRKIRMRVFFFRTTWTFCDATDGKSHLIDCPLPTERFRPHMVRRMQKNKTLGVVRRSLIVGRKK